MNQPARIAVAATTEVGKMLVAAIVLMAVVEGTYAIQLWLDSRRGIL